MPLTEPVIIVGAGVVGLAIAQGLRKAKIPFLLLERSPRDSTRSHGWGLTIHWALPTLLSLLPDAIISRLPETQVIPSLTPETDAGRFVFLDASDASVKFEVPRAARRLRVHRGRFRELLCAGLEEEGRVVYGAKVVDVKVAGSHAGQNSSSSSSVTSDGGSDPGAESNSSEGVVVTLADGRAIRGSLLVGADGSSSTIRRALLPEKSQHSLYHLPLRLLGCTVRLAPATLEEYKSIDPLLFQASHPTSGVYMWYSLLDSATSSVQLCVSWNHASECDEVPSSDAERVGEMKRRTEDFAAILRDLVRSVPETTRVQEIKIADWLPLRWKTGRVTLAGDAFHAMTMFRGEAANHGFLDARGVVDAVAKIHEEGVDVESALGEYEGEVRARTKDAVLLSRKAAMDAHDWDSLVGGDSPVVGRRGADAGKKD